MIFITFISLKRLANTFKKTNDVGFLVVRIIEAWGLRSADFSGLSDPFVVLQIGNKKVQTHTEYNNLNPIWEKVFTL